MKGNFGGFCWWKKSRFCGEPWCDKCQIYLDRQEAGRLGKMKEFRTAEESKNCDKVVQAPFSSGN